MITPDCAEMQIRCRRMERRRTNRLQKSVASFVATLGSDPKKNAAAVKKLATKMKKAAVSEDEVKALVGDSLPGFAISDVLATPFASAEGRPISSGANPKRKAPDSAASVDESQQGSVQSDGAASGNEAAPDQQLRRQNLSAEFPAGRQFRFSSVSAESSDPFFVPADMFRRTSSVGGPQPPSRPLCPWTHVFPPAKMPTMMLSQSEPSMMPPDMVLEKQSGMLDEMEHESLHLCVGPGCTICRNAGGRQPGASSAGHCMQRGYGSETRYSQSLPSANALPEAHIARIAMKIDRASPDHLPPDLLERVHNIVKGFRADEDAAVEGYIRPGCLMLTVDVPVGREAHAAGAILQERATRLLLDDSLTWIQHNIDLVLPDGCHIRHSPGGTTEDAQPAAGPELLMVQMATSERSVQVSVRGWEGVEAKYTFHCRLEGRYIEARIIDSFPVSDDLHGVTLRLEGDENGLGWIEIVNDNPKEFYISEALPVLVTDNSEICGEVLSLMQCGHMLSKAEAVGVLKDVDAILSFDERGYFSPEVCSRLVSLAARCGWTHTVQECIDLMTMDMEMPEILAAWPQLLLHSVQSGNLAAVAQAVSCYIVSGVPIPLGVSDKHGLTVLHWAAMVGNEEVASLLQTFDDDGEGWQNSKALHPPFLTPAQMLQTRHTAIPSAPPHATPSDLQEPQVAEHQDTQPPVLVDDHSQATYTRLMFPVIFTAVFFFSGEYRSWASALLVALLGGLVEYAARYTLPQAQAERQQNLADEHPEAAVRFGGKLGAFEFLSDFMRQRYLVFWHQAVARYDRLMFVGFVLKLAAYSFKLPPLWLIKWSSPILLLLVLRCVRRQPAKHQELCNMALAAYSWFGFWLGVLTEMQLELPPLEKGLQLMSCLSSSASVLLLSVHYAVVFPVRMDQRKVTALLCCCCAFTGLELRTLISPVCQQAGVMQCAVHSLSYAVLPTICAYLGTEIGCTWVEMDRLRAFLSSSVKKIA
mmetsp:Transcript_43018/g.111513  ORF Transcript_43018/g.111513 Transcript_43018/m.111513 type:complete len:984 (+) Transcript_43018:43-2994(+)